MPSELRPFSTLIPTICASLLSVASAWANEAPHAEAKTRAARWSPATSNSYDPLAANPIVKLDHEIPAFEGMNESWIADPEISIPCDASSHLASGAACDDISCGGGDQFWANAEYLYWHLRGAEIPALVTTSSTGTERDQAGVLGRSTTSILLGDERFSDEGQSGGRFSFGFWIDDCRDVGIEFIYTTFGDRSDSFAASSDQFPILARPFFNVDSLAEDARILGFPNEVSGGIRVQGSTEYDVYELLIRRPVSQDPITPTYIVYGYRSAELDDSLRLIDSSLSLSGATAGATVTSIDSFRSRNVFHGFEAGILTDFQLSQCWQLNVEGKVAFGETDHTTTITGQTVSTNSQGDSATSTGGLLTQSSNIGSFESNSHGVLQDFKIGLRRYMQRESRRTLATPSIVGQMSHVRASKLIGR